MYVCVCFYSIFIIPSVSLENPDQYTMPGSIPAAAGGMTLLQNLSCLL